MRFPRFFAGKDAAEPIPAGEPPHVEHHVVELDEDQLRALSRVFTAPRWLRDLGIASWLLAGVALLLLGGVWLVALTSTIVDPVVAGLIVAVVASPIVGWLHRHRWPRGAGAAIVLLGLVVVVVGVIVIVIGSVIDQSEAIAQHANEAAPRVQGWLTGLGVDSSGAQSATDSVKAATPETISTFVHGLANGIVQIASIALGLSFAALSVFFLLKDGPSMRAWTESHLGVSRPVAHVITGETMTSLRRYFAGVTLVATFNAIVVGLGALILGVPLAFTIAVVTFITAYVPYIGAFVSGAFAVVIALGAEGTTTALIMLVIVILANGLLQNIFQPIAYGATLQLNPLVVLIVTIGAGCLFGMIGLVLAAPITSAIVHINGKLRNARLAAARAAAPVEPTPS